MKKLTALILSLALVLSATPVSAIEFDDVSADSWYADAVSHVVSNKLMNGYGTTSFGPDDTLSRAMIAQILYNKEGAPAISDKHGFSDVPTDQWYNNAVTWASQEGVMSGYSSSTFGPDDNVTIEQAAVILWNYSGTPSFTATADSLGNHSDWATNALSWAVEHSLLGNLPHETVTEGATRAQTAQLLTNYLTGSAAASVVCRHKWAPGSCFAPKTCSACGLTEGGIGNHVPTKAGTCALCSQPTRVPLLNHEYGPMELVSYSKLDGTYAKTDSISSLVFTNASVEEGDGNRDYRFFAKIKGSFDMYSAGFTIRFYSADDLFLGEVSVSPQVYLPGDYDTYLNVYIEKEIVDLAARIEFVSTSGHPAQGGNADTIVVPASSFRFENDSPSGMPLLGHEYGPMTSTSYFNSGRPMRTNHISSFVFTDVYYSPFGNTKLYRVWCHIKGRATKAPADVSVYFYDANHKEIYHTNILLDVEPNTDYEKLDVFYVEKHILDRTASIEFSSLTGQPVTYP